MATNRSHVLEIKRHQVYAPWRAAAEVVEVIRAMRRGDVSERDAPAALRELAASLPEIAPHLPLEARVAANDLVPVLRVGLPIEELLQPVWSVFQTFGQLLLNIDGMQPRFAADHPPLAVEKRLLAAAYALDAQQHLDAKVEVRELVEQSGVELAVTRRVICYWLDGGLVYLPGDLQAPEETEHFVLAEGADERRDHWSEYERERIDARRVRISVPYTDQLPHDWEKTVEGAAMDAGIDYGKVLPTLKGLIIDAVLPEEWARNDMRVETFVGHVKEMLAKPRIQPAVHAPVNTFVANQVGAQGPNAVAASNTFIQRAASASWEDSDRLAVIEELVLLRGALWKTAGGNLEEAHAFVFSVQAETAARNGDRAGMLSALSAFGPRLLTLCDELDLSRLKREIVGR